MLRGSGRWAWKGRIGEAPWCCWWLLLWVPSCKPSRDGIVGDRTNRILRWCKSHSWNHHKKLLVVVSRENWDDPHLGKWCNLINIFQLSWNHQPENSTSCMTFTCTQKSLETVDTTECHTLFYFQVGVQLFSSVLGNANLGMSSLWLAFQSATQLLLETADGLVRHVFSYRLKTAWTYHERTKVSKWIENQRTCIYFACKQRPATFISFFLRLIFCDFRFLHRHFLLLEITKYTEHLLSTPIY